MDIKDRFEKINQDYKDYYKESFLRKGMLPMKNTELGIWGYSLGEEVFELFNKIGLDRKKSFLDLGSGDGVVVNIASLFTKAEGIEIDAELVGVSNDIKKKHKLSNASFLQKDFMKHDISKYDLLFIYPDKRLNEVEEKLAKEMKGYLLFAGYHFHPTNLKKVKSFTVNGNLFTVYGNKIK